MRVCTLLSIAFYLNLIFFEFALLPPGGCAAEPGATTSSPTGSSPAGSSPARPQHYSVPVPPGSSPARPRYYSVPVPPIATATPPTSRAGEARAAGAAAAELRGGRDNGAINSRVSPATTTPPQRSTPVGSSPGRDATPKVGRCKLDPGLKERPVSNV